MLKRLCMKWKKVNVCNMHNDKFYKPLVFFTSKLCPDFAIGQSEEQRMRRPFAANSQCGRLYEAFMEGKELSVRQARILCGCEDAGRRIREVRKYMAQEGHKLADKWINNGHARFKVYYKG